MPVPQRTGRVVASVRPERRMLVLLGTGFTDMFLPDLRTGDMCYGGRDLLWVVSGSGFGHSAAVTLEGWSTEPGLCDGPWEERAETGMFLSEGSLYISGMFERRLSEPVAVAERGACRARVYARGRREIDRIARAVPDPEDMPPDVERFLIQVWPHEGPGRRRGGSPGAR